AAAKAPEIATLQAFANSALGAVAVEQALHGRYLQEFGVDPASVMAAESAPDCLAYTSFLIATAHQEPWEVLVAALLPCFWIYWDVAQAISRDAAPENPFRAWIDTYADPHFGEAVGRVIGVADAAAAATTPRIRACAVGGRLERRAGRAPTRHARRDRATRRYDAAAHARRADRHPRPGADTRAVRGGAEHLWAHRSVVQQRRHQHPRHPLRGIDLRAMVGCRRGQPHRLVPVRPACLPHDEGAGPAGRADHQQRLGVGACAAAQLN